MSHRSWKPARRAAASSSIVLACAIAAAPGRASAEEAAPSPAGQVGPRSDPRAEQAAARVRAIESAALEAQVELRRTRPSHDAARIACVDDRLTRLHVAARAARGRFDELRAADGASDDRAATLAATRLAHLEERARKLRAEVRACSEPEVWIEHDGATTVRVVAPPLPEAAEHPTAPAVRP